jgi:hypothetical protein
MNKLTGTIIGGVMIIGGVTYTDAQINPYVESELVYELSEVSISKDKPEYKLSKWGEEEITIKRAGEFLPQERDLFSTELKSDSVDGKETMVITPVENGTKIDLILNEKPNTNVFDFEVVGWEDFDFFYQPELTPEEIAEGYVRPEDVVGSYAVYHKSKKSNQYQTGKAFHIYRPKIIDANGAEVWGELTFSEGVLSVLVPQKFLDTASYPVRVDPTFGKTVVGGSSFSTASSDYLWGPNADTPSLSNGVVTSCSFYTKSNSVGAAGSFKVGFYRDSDLALIGQSDQGTAPASQAWITVDVADVAITNVAYRVATFSDRDSGGGQTPFYFFDTGGSGATFSGSYTYPTFPNPLVNTGSTNIPTMYCTYGDIVSNLDTHWKFDEGSGTTATDSVGSNDGSLENGASYTTGQIGTNAVSLDGTDDHVLTPIALPNTTYSISWWMKGIPANAVANIFAQDVAGSEIAISYVPASNAFSYENTYNTSDTVGGWNYTLDSNWHHIVLVESYTGTDVDNAQFYVDGVLISSLYAGTAQSINAGNMHIGARPGGTNAYGGIIDDVRIYSRALTAGDVAVLYAYTESGGGGGDAGIEVEAPAFQEF